MLATGLQHAHSIRLDGRYLNEAFNLSDLDDAATARTNLGLVSGGAGDIWVDTAGDTMTGNLTINKSEPVLILKSSAAVMDSGYVRWQDTAGAFKWSLGNDYDGLGGQNLWITNDVDASVPFYVDSQDIGLGEAVITGSTLTSAGIVYRASTNQVQFPNAVSSAATVQIGGDVDLYRSAINVLTLGASDTFNLLDNDTIKFGTGLDASIYYDATDMIVLPAVVGTGGIRIGGTTSDTDVFMAIHNSKGSQLNISDGDTDDGMYFRNYGANGTEILNGAKWTGSAREARATAAQSLIFAVGDLDWYSNTALTVGITYTAVLKMSITNAGLLKLPITGSGAGVLIGGDTQLYRSAADKLTLATGDKLGIGGVTPTYDVDVAYSSTSPADGAIPQIIARNTGTAATSFASIEAIAGNGLERIQILASNGTALPVGLYVRAVTAQPITFLQNVTTLASFETDGELRLPLATAAGQGILIGGDVELYRSAADILSTPDTVKIGGSLLVGSATGTPSGLLELQGASPFVFLQDTDSAGNNAIGGFVVQDNANTNKVQFGKLTAGTAHASILNSLSGGNILLITTGQGTGVVIGNGEAGTDNILSFDGETNDGLITWMEDEDYFLFNDDIILPDNETIKFGTGLDASITYDGTNTIVNPKVVGSGYLSLLGNMGINATATEYLTVGGRTRSTRSDIAVEDNTRGIILKDTQATPHYWRITVTVAGVVTTADLGTSLPAE